MQAITFKQPIFVAPHLDDAALSCGGLMRALVQQGEEVLAITVFAGSPMNDELTPIARELKTRWKTGKDPVAVRRAEDVAACRVLGVSPIHLAWTDCVYRPDASGQTGLYPSEESLFGPVHPEDNDLPATLCRAILEQVKRDLLPLHFLAPLGAGHHVDHQLVRDACLGLLRQGHQVTFYEDYPYANDPQAVQDAINLLPDWSWSAEVVTLTDEQLKAKVRAVACYASQIDTFWRDKLGQPDLEAMRQALEHYARRVGQTGYAERYWTPSEPQADL